MLSDWVCSGLYEFREFILVLDETRQYIYRFDSPPTCNPSVNFGLARAPRERPSTIARKSSIMIGKYMWYHMWYECYFKVYRSPYLEQSTPNLTSANDSEHSFRPVWELTKILSCVIETSHLEVPLQIIEPIFQWNFWKPLVGQLTVFFRYRPLKVDA
jgi:hypothetical protein